MPHQLEAGCEDGAMAEVRTVHTADLDTATLEAARTLLDDVFAGDMTDHDWEHALGGMHALVWEGDELIGHASLVQRRLLHGGHALRAGYVEGVGGARTGAGAAMMEALERVVRGAYDLARWSLSTMPRISTRCAAGRCGRGRPQRSPRPASSAPRRRTAASMSFRWRSRWIWPARSPATGAMATSGSPDVATNQCPEPWGTIYS